MAKTKRPQPFLTEGADMPRLSTEIQVSVRRLFGLITRPRGRIVSSYVCFSTVDHTLVFNGLKGPVLLMSRLRSKAHKGPTHFGQFESALDSLS